LRSFFRHPGQPKAGEIRGLEQGSDFRHPPAFRPNGLQADDARKTIVHGQPAGFGELGGAAFGFASEGIGRRLTRRDRVSH
jgi:hypothetical protein